MEIRQIKRISTALFDPATNAEIIKQAIYCLIWVPYFLLSVRVKNTFIIGRKQAVIQDESHSIIN